jgi:hypothetical protein
MVRDLAHQRISFSGQLRTKVLKEAGELISQGENQL